MWARPSATSRWQTSRPPCATSFRGTSRSTNTRRQRRRTSSRRSVQRVVPGSRIPTATCSACVRARSREPASPSAEYIIHGVARRWPIVFALGATLLGAAVLRFWDLASNPGGLYTDEAIEALSAHQILTVPGFHPVFFTDGGGREALFAYLVAGVFRFAGESTLALRATAAGIGVAGV